MQMNNLVRLFNSSRLRISARTSLPSYQLDNGFKTTSLLFNSTTPERPKRPINAYLRYVQSIRANLHAQNPKASPVEISKLAAAQWQVLDAASKSKLEDDYKKDQAVWIQENAKYLSQLTDQQKDDIRQARVDKVEERVKREHKKKLKELGRPKRPMNGFLLFSADKKPKNLNRDQNREQIKQMAQEWAQMSEKEKAPYNNRAADALVKYREDVKKWEEKMIAQNHEDVVRRKTTTTTKDSKTRSSK